jgi:hypothetical protein
MEKLDGLRKMYYQNGNLSVDIIQIPFRWTWKSIMKMEL